MTSSQQIQAHYTIAEMPARVEAALHAAGFGAGPVVWSDLAELDQFHARGLAATAELAAALGPRAGESVLDLGSGLGGPARYLAAVHGCRVTGIELTPAYVEVADLLSRRSGLADQLRFVPGDALALPFADASFDHAWTQHVAMNVADKAALYRGVHRVLRPGGRFALYDAVLGEGGPVIYPVPWARGPEVSFLVTTTALREELRAAGFREVLFHDPTEQALAWFTGLSTGPGSTPPRPLSLPGILGPQVRPWVGNFARNLAEGRVRLAQLVVERP